jgi:hypothetical protein
MEKSAEDYRNIVKVLKVKALQLKAENEYLASQLSDVSALARKDNCATLTSLL